MSGRAALGAALAALLGLALLAGCGGDSGTEAGAPDTARTTTQVIVQTASEGFDAAEIYRQASPGVVTIRSIFDGGAAEGSGFVLDAEGRIVTNAHVVTDGEGDDRKEAEAVFVEFTDRNVVPARIVGFDPFADVALLEVEPDGFELHPLELGDDDELVVGQPVAAIGSPFGEQQSLSVGIVSATDRSVGSLTQFQIEGAIQTDASINPGNSGGPLLDGGARVIGINQQIETSSGANDGVGFAVPISAVKRSLAQLKRTATSSTPTSASPARRSTRSSPPSSVSTPSTAACWPKSYPAVPPTRRGSREVTASSVSRESPTRPGATRSWPSTAAR